MVLLWWTWQYCFEGGLEKPESAQSLLGSLWFLENKDIEINADNGGLACEVSGDSKESTRVVYVMYLNKSLWKRNICLNGKMDAGQLEQKKISNDS